MTIRTLSILIVALVFTSASYAKSLYCSTPQKVLGQNGSTTFEVLRVKAKIEGGDLVSPVTEGAYEAHVLGKILGKNSQNGKWKRFSGMEDSWCSFALIVPGNFQIREKEAFQGVLDKVCEGGQRSGSYRLKCTVR